MKAEISRLEAAPTKLKRQSSDYAREAFDKVLAIDPKNFHAHNNLGIIYRQEGRLPAAVVHFRAAVRLNPNFLQARYNLGEALLRQGQNDEARVHFHKIVAAGYRLPGHIEESLKSAEP